MVQWPEPGTRGVFVAITSPSLLERIFSFLPAVSYLNALVVLRHDLKHGVLVSVGGVRQIDIGQPQEACRQGEVLGSV